MDAPRVDAWSLHCLAVFVREQSVTRAGAVLGLSQPAASAVLAKLRKTFGDPLLVKSASGMVPTPRAMELRRHCERLLLDMRAMLEPDTIADPIRFEGSVAIAAIDMIRALVLPSLLPLLAVEAPGVAVRVHHADRTQIHNRLENGSVDLGIGPDWVATGRLHYKQLWADRAVLIAGRSTFHEAVVDAERLCDFQAATTQPSKPSFFDDQLDKALAAIGLHRRIAFVENSYIVLAAVLECSRLVAVVPARVGHYAARRYALSIRECPLNLTELNIGMYWHERTHRDLMYAWVRDRIASCAPNMLTTSTGNE